MRLRSFCIIGLLAAASGCAAPIGQQNLLSSQQALDTAPQNVVSGGPIKPTIPTSTELDPVRMLSGLFQHVLTPKIW